MFVLFLLFEGLMLAATVVLFSFDPRGYDAICNAAGVTFLYSFFGLLAVSFLLRRFERRWAVIGWYSLLGFFFLLLFLPVV